ncbi:protein PML-like [Argopecten irradians]|uniref:protein PML-like n=1 Tax=Argopecten irradians TaxID=31199 RepID=UPI003722EF8F
MADINQSRQITKQVQDYAKCLLCFKPNACLRDLPCFHSFCPPCFDSFTHPESDTNKRLLCPVCETHHQFSILKSSTSIWASFLPHDVTSSVKPGRGDEVVCEGCRRDGEDTRATHWCRHCTEALCSSCKIAHRRNKKTTDHRVIDIRDVQNTESLPLKLSFYENCFQHPGKTLEIYCLDHQALCCILCLAVSHRECKHVRSIEDVSKEPRATCSDMWISLENKSKTLTRQYNDAISMLDRDKEHITATMSAKLNTARKKIDKLQERFNHDVEMEHKKNKQDLLNYKENAEQFYTNIKNTQMLMSALENHVDSRQAFIALNIVSVQLTRHYQRMKHRLLQAHKLFSLELEVEDTVDKINALTSVGTVTTTTKISDATKEALTTTGAALETIRKMQACSSLGDSMSSSDMIGSLTRGRLIVRKETKSEMKTVKSRLIKSVESKTLGGKQVILLTGGTFVDEKWLVMADCNNKRVLLFDENYTYLKQYAIDGCPTDIARGNKISELYVAVFNKEILKCSLASGHLDVIGRTKFPSLTCGIDLLDGKLIVVTVDSVKILEESGQEVNSVQLTTTGSTCIGVCKNNRRYYHRSGNSVVGHTLDGREETRYTHSQLSDPVGVCLDSEANVLVCGYQSGNIHSIFPDGVQGRVLVRKLDKIKHPWAVIAHQSKREFVVTSCKEAVAFEVYQMC